jgi:hypothetical protein
MQLILAHCHYYHIMRKVPGVNIFPKLLFSRRFQSGKWQSPLSLFFIIAIKAEAYSSGTSYTLRVSSFF